MTLAVILLLYFPCIVPRADLAYQSATATPAATQNQETAQPQAAPATQASPPATTPAKPSATPSHAAKKPVRKKKTAASNCDAGSAPAGSGPSTNSASKTPGAGAGNNSAQNSGSTAPSKNCPPPKIIVSHGGTSESSLQLEGGSGGTGATQQRDATAQMLGTTENNLKKLSGQQLSQSQQDSVTQVRQFIEQSKTALASGDTDRARTLAWKAKTLSEDLVKPQQ
jgi:hypothetical protein